MVPLTVEELEWRELLSAASDLFLSRVYPDLLQRPPDPAGLTAWGGILDHGTSRETVALGIQDSQEYHTHQIHDRYAQLLCRTPDPFGRAAFLSFLDHGGTADDLTARVLSSPEYDQAHGGNVAAFLTAVYHDLLDRTPDALGMTAFTAALAAGASRHAGQVFPGGLRLAPPHGCAAGRMGDATGEMSDARIQELIYPEIMRKKPPWLPTSGTGGAAPASPERTAPRDHLDGRPS
jgi:hypothetical protein